MTLDPEEDDIPAKPIRGSGRGRGRGRARGRGARGAKGAAQNKRRREESSEEESISESEEEEEVIRKPPPSRSGRAARNTKRVNYAAIEESGEVLDYLLG